MFATVFAVASGVLAALLLWGGIAVVILRVMDWVEWKWNLANKRYRNVYPSTKPQEGKEGGTK